MMYKLTARDAASVAEYVNTVGVGWFAEILADISKAAWEGRFEVECDAALPDKIIRALQRLGFTYEDCTQTRKAGECFSRIQWKAEDNEEPVIENGFNATQARSIQGGMMKQQEINAWLAAIEEAAYCSNSLTIYKIMPDYVRGELASRGFFVVYRGDRSLIDGTHGEVRW